MQMNFAVVLWENPSQEPSGKIYLYDPKLMNTGEQWEHASAFVRSANHI